MKNLAIDLGFTGIGIAPAKPSPTFDKYTQWLDARMHGSMEYMARQDRIERRRNLDLLVPNARSIVVVSLNYLPALLPMSVLKDPRRGRISNYAWGADYHVNMLTQLLELKEYITSATNGQAVSREYVDTGPILERSHAEHAGLGFVGKNTMLIDPRRGSYQFLGVIITTCELDAEPPVSKPSCGSCTRCMTQCPTHAFPAPFVLDARKCISYLTIENKGWIPKVLRSQMENWVYGCDVCQEVCPWQRFAQPAINVPYNPIDPDRVAPALSTLLSLTEEGFLELFGEGPIARIGRDRLVRNACIASGNSKDTELIDPLVELSHDPSPIVRGHAIWALSQLGTPIKVYEQALAHEQDIEVRQEIMAALDTPSDQKGRARLTCHD